MLENTLTKIIRPKWAKQSLAWESLHSDAFTSATNLLEDSGEGGCSRQRQDILFYTTTEITCFCGHQHWCQLLSQQNLLTSSSFTRMALSSWDFGFLRFFASVTCEKHLDFTLEGNTEKVLRNCSGSHSDIFCSHMHPLQGKFGVSPRSSVHVWKQLNRDRFQLHTVIQCIVCFLKYWSVNVLKLTTRATREL